MSDIIKLTIDGRECTCEKGEFLYDVAARNGIFIPTLCRHDGFEHRGACRVCIVEVSIRGRAKVVTSCIYPVEQECEVLTKSEKVEEERRMVIALLASRAPEAERIRRLASFYKVEVPECFVRLDQEKCILCGLCMQACESLGTGAISTLLRGTEKMVGTPYGRPSPACVGCRSCAEVCPTEAIEWSETEDTRTIWGSTFQLKRCERCGEVLGTVEEVAWAASRTGNEPAVLCDACRKRRMADVLAAAYGR